MAMKHKELNAIETTSQSQVSRTSVFHSFHRGLLFRLTGWRGLEWTLKPLVSLIADSSIERILIEQKRLEEKGKKKKKKGFKFGDSQ